MGVKDVYWPVVAQKGYWVGLLNICLTIDVDWAPKKILECAIKVIGGMIPFTIFVTDNCQGHFDEPIEVGWHPNFRGTLPRTELEKLNRLFPKAAGLRPHALYSENVSAEVLLEYGLKWVSASSMPQSTMPSLFQDRIPDFRISWGDNMWINRSVAPDYNMMIEDRNGYYVINFHPIHIYLNSFDFLEYSKLKPFITDIDYLAQFRNSKHRGVHDLLKDVLILRQKRSVRFMTLSQAYQDATDNHFLT